MAHHRIIEEYFSTWEDWLVYMEKVQYSTANDVRSTEKLYNPCELSWCFHISVHQEFTGTEQASGVIVLWTGTTGTGSSLAPPKPGWESRGSRLRCMQQSLDAWQSIVIMGTHRMTCYKIRSQVNEQRVQRQLPVEANPTKTYDIALAIEAVECDPRELQRTAWVQEDVCRVESGTGAKGTATLPKNSECYHCKKVGHILRACCDKQSL